MYIRKTELQDLPHVMVIYEGARKFMREHGNPRQWNTSWPPENLIRKDITEGHSYICVDFNIEKAEEDILAVFYYLQGDHAEPAYDQIDGAFTGNETYGVVHRIAVNDKGRGVGSYCLHWAFDQCGNLRIDTHPDNRIMKNTLKKNGFRYCGTVHVAEDNDLRLAYEKLC